MPSPYLEIIDESGKECRRRIVDKLFLGRRCWGIEEDKRLIVPDELVSRDHAVISWSGNDLKIRDMSKNGTWVNNVRITAGSSHVLSDGDELRVGSVVMRVHNPVSANFQQDAEEVTVIATQQVIVSNLVADIRGFSSFSQREDSRNVYDLIKTAFETLSSIVDEYQGTFKDYAGDAIFAYWHHRSLSPKEQALLACQAALKQASAVGRMRKLSPEDPSAANLNMGWGITTGKVTISHYGSRTADVAIVGDSTNLAFRLSGLANKDLSSEIVICSRTADLVCNTLPVLDLGLVPIRGRSGQENVFGIR